MHYFVNFSKCKTKEKRTYFYLTSGNPEKKKENKDLVSTNDMDLNIST